MVQESGQGLSQRFAQTETDLVNGDDDLAYMVNLRLPLIPESEPQMFYR